MRLPFLDRKEEVARLGALFARAEGSLAVIFGRRRVGKTRLLQTALVHVPAVYYVADDREASLQRATLAREMARLLPGFAEAYYPGWEALFARFWREARPGTVLALDEFPALVSSAPEVPSLLQKQLDEGSHAGVHLALTGSSQRMMHGLVLDRTAPLFGRAREVLKVGALGAGWIGRALAPRNDARAVEAYALWGGIPRYWELAGEYSDPLAALIALVLSPLGVLHEEPTTLLLDDLRDVTQASSILALIGCGCHRLSEIAGRLGKPATSLARPLARLIDLGLVRRDVPFGASRRDSKRTAYALDDPFLRLWFRYVEPNRSRLGAGQVKPVAREVGASLPLHVGSVWQELVRASVPRTPYFRREWGPAARWWGAGLNRQPMEVDVVAASLDGKALLVGEAKWSDRIDWDREASALREKAARLPLASGKRVMLGLWTKSAAPSRRMGVSAFSPRDVVRVLR